MEQKEESSDAQPKTVEVAAVVVALRNLCENFREKVAWRSRHLFEETIEGMIESLEKGKPVEGGLTQDDRYDLIFQKLNGGHPPFPDFTKESLQEIARLAGGENLSKSALICLGELFQYVLSKPGEREVNICSAHRASDEQATFKAYSSTTKTKAFHEIHEFFQENADADWHCHLAEPVSGKNLGLWLTLRRVVKADDVK